MRCAIKFISLMFVQTAVLLVGAMGLVQAATPGLPFTEDFSDTSLRDAGLTSANWSTEEQAVYAAWAS